MKNLTKDDARGCGMGRGADCCIFLVVGADGFECARESDMAGALVARQPEMTSKRMPTAPIPECRLPVEN